MYFLSVLRSLSWNSNSLAKELGAPPEASKRKFINLQWVVALGTSYLLFSGSKPLAESPWESIIIALLLGSVLVLYNLPTSVFSQTIFTYVLTMTDTLLVVIGIAFSKESPWDLFLILFFGLFIAAIGESFIKIVCGCLLMSFVFVVFAAYEAGSLSVYDFELFQKMPFIIGNFLLLGYLAEQVKHEKMISVQRQNILYEINLALTSTLDVHAVLDVLLQKIKILLPYSAATITLLNKEIGIFERIACWNIDEHEWKSVAAMESDLKDRCLENGPVPVRKINADIPSPAYEFLRKEGLVSYLRVPLVVGNEVLGALTFFTREEHEFSKQEVQFLSMLASQAAIATSNSQLYERTRRQAVELERANKEKDESLGIVSHELKTPLHVVLAGVSLIKDGALGTINPEQKKILEKVIDCSNDQSAMINSLLDTTALESGSIKVSRHKVDLDAFLAELRVTHENPLRKELSLIWDYPPDLPIIKTDRHKLKLILQNLINNAVKFTPSGRIAISARYLAEQNEVKLTVADTGIGIPKDSLAIIFDKFRQVSGSETKNCGGIGLGLYLVEKFTQLIGGRIEVESELGKGSTFAITLPCESEHLVEC
jgi:signal transduction histidine kinase